MNKLGKVFIFIGSILIIVSIILLTYNNYQEINAGKKSEIALDIIKNNIDTQNETNTIVNEEIMKWKLLMY